MLTLELCRGKLALGEVARVKVLAEGESGQIPAVALQIFSPSGRIQELELSCREGQRWAWFLPGETGIYRLLAALAIGAQRYLAWAYLVVEEEGRWREPEGKETLDMVPVFHEGSYLRTPIRLRLRWNGNPLPGQECVLTLAPWLRSELRQRTDAEGCLWLDDRGQCYWEQQEEKLVALSFYPWGSCWLITTKYSAPSGEHLMVTCTLPL
ncbi:hypothetical protein [Desulfothermobacter acidiphilus]|uniref:hypothetical protein n=1 Tax=Desulfothermobacter acidiphilus TaxID=1938353 RepID=UPI003F889C9D